ncbi:MAG TPA: YncE family protein [Ignavibacteriaceae bacterium]|nr:YncE family protein [Ignavibacteriaceae bacterium]
MKKMFGFLSLILLLFPFLMQSNIIAQTSGYKIVKTIPIGGETRWDYLAVDNTYHRLFLSHSSSVAVIDISNNSFITEIKDLQGVHGICFAPEFNKGFISNGRDSSVTVFDLKTLKVLSKIQVTGKNPDAIMYDPFTKRVFIMNGRSANTTAIDAKSGKVVGTLALDGKPEFAVSDLTGKVYVNIEDKSEIQEFDSKNLKVLNTWSIAPGEEPSGLAIDIKNNRLFSVCGNELLVVVDSKSGKIITTLPIGKGVDACVFDNEDQQIFSSNGEGNLTVIKEKSPSDFEIIDTIITERGARTMAFDEKTKKIFTDAAPEGKDGSKNFTVLVLGKN